MEQEESKRIFRADLAEKARKDVEHICRKVGASNARLHFAEKLVDMTMVVNVSV